MPDSKPDHTETTSSATDDSATGTYGADRERNPLDTSVQFLPGVGPKRVGLFEKLGIRTVRELLFHCPHSVNDFSNIVTVPRMKAQEEQSVFGKVVDADARSLRNNRTLVAVLLDCDGHYVRGVWFNQPWMLKKFQDGDQIIFSGKPKRAAGRWEFNNPRVQWIDADTDISGGVLPRYALTDGLSMDKMRQATRAAVEIGAELIADPLPPSFRERLHLPEVSQALRGLHTPQSLAEFESSRNRLLLDDLLEFQLGMALRRVEWTRDDNAQPLEITARIDARIRRLFDFSFTKGQDNAVAEICTDLAKSQPMHRLLQADVGAGKTAVAAYAMLLAVAKGKQAALMAPTEVLANQHWQTLDGLLQKSRVNRGLLIGGLPAAQRRELLTNIASGETQLIVGTQAIIQDAVSFDSLALVVIDEQHRFGVRQRAWFSSDSSSPHVLVMTATPIPRSLCLTQFGDLDVSTIGELPPGRQRIVTARIDSPAERAKVWTFVVGHVQNGRQAYVVCPRVEGQDDQDDAAAEAVFESLRNNELRGITTALLHGRMSREDRHDVMDRFRNGQVQVLISTTVIEVGVDVANATLMVIQQAERFGLAQLHQLRGRVGRGRWQGYCFLFSESASDDASSRLQAMVDSSDGFRLAEIDAELRGPGDLLGTRQSGRLPLRVADPVRDIQLLARTQTIARKLVESGDFDKPEFAALKEVVMDRFGELLQLSRTG